MYKRHCEHAFITEQQLLPLQMYTAVLSEPAK